MHSNYMELMHFYQGANLLVTDTSVNEKSGRILEPNHLASLYPVFHDEILCMETAGYSDRCTNCIAVPHQVSVDRVAGKFYMHTEVINIKPAGVVFLTIAFRVPLGCPV